MSTGIARFFNSNRLIKYGSRIFLQSKRIKMIENEMQMVVVLAVFSRVNRRYKLC